MTIQTIMGKRRYQQNPKNPCEVQVQYKYRGAWTTFALRDTPKEAAKLVLTLAHSGTAGDDNAEKS